MAEDPDARTENDLGLDEALASGSSGDGETGVDGDEDFLASPSGELVQQLMSFPRGDLTAPAWLESRILQVWVSLPPVTKMVLSGLASAKGQSRIELIRAGVNRKYRNGWRDDSAIAENLAALARKSPVLWRNVARTALRTYVGPEGIASEDLPALAGDPLDFYDTSEQPPEAVLLCAIALGIEDGTLEILSADCANLLGEREVARVADKQQDRIRSLEEECAEQKTQIKTLEKAARAQQKQEQSLEAEVEQLRARQEEVGSAAEAARAKLERDLRKRAEDAEGQLEDSRVEADRVPELEAQIQGLEEIAERLEDADGTAREERRLREQAEQDANRHLQRIRELTDEVGQARDSRNLPVDDAAALIAALSRPIGQATRHVAERLASGRARTEDHLMLELASAVARIVTASDHLVDQPVQDVEPEGVKAPESIPWPDEPAVSELVAAPESDGASGSVPEAESGETPEHSAGLPGRRRRRPRLMIQPLGGAGEVGGSAILVRNQSGHTVLLDCGQRVRGEYGLPTEPQFHHRTGIEGPLHAMLISHAHIDHVGSIPVFHREQSNAQSEPIPIYMTEPTRALARIMLEDSAKIQQSREAAPGDLGFIDYGPSTMEAAYRQADVTRVFEEDFVNVVEPARVVPIPETSFIARFLPVAHVLGSCAIHLTDTQHDQTLLYTGDLGPIADPQITLPNYSLGEMLPADMVVMESTYGIRPDHEREGRRLRLSGRERAIQSLYDAAAHAHQNDGCLLLPAFSLGRTQELAKVIHQGRIDGRLPEGGEIYIAGMGEKIINEYVRFSKGDNPWGRADSLPRTEELGNKIRKQGLDFDDAVGEVLGEGFSYIIASPAMLTSGWSRNFLENMVDDPRHAIILSGYMPKHAGGIPRLHHLAQGDEIDLAGDRRKILAKWERAPALSAHAPSQDLRRFADYMIRQGDQVAFGMVHGDPAAQEALADDVDAMPGASAESLNKGQVWRPQRPS